MKILFVQKEGGIFGAENYQLKVIPGLLAKGIHIEFLRLYTDHQGGKGGEFIERLNQLGVKTYEVNIGKYPTPRVLNQIKRIANNDGYDLVHTHLIHADFYLALVKSFLGLKTRLVSTKHGYDNNFTSRFGFDASKQTKTPYFLISKWAEKKMDASFTISKGLLDFFIATGLTKESKMKLIHYGFDMADHHNLKNDKGEFRRSSKQIFMAGRLVGFKGHRLLLEVMPQVVEQFGSDVKLLIAGTGELKADLKKQVSRLGIEEHIEFLGYSKDVGAYMANSDVIMVPSISEGFGVVFLEAFSAKTPVIAWDVPAGNELMEHQESGYLVEPYQLDKLALQIIEVLNNPEKQVTITQKAYDRLKNYFNLDRMIKETTAFYSEVSKL